MTRRLSLAIVMARPTIHLRTGSAHFSRLGERRPDRRVVFLENGACAGGVGQIVETMPAQPHDEVFPG